MYVYLMYHCIQPYISTEQQYNSCTWYTIHNVLLHRCCYICCVHIQQNRFTQTLSLVLRRAWVRAAVHPRTLGEIRGRNAPGRHARDSHTIGIDKNSTSYNADNNNKAATGTQAVLRCAYITRPPSLARRRSYWMYTAVPELIHIYLVSKSMYLVYYHCCRYWCMCCVHPSLALCRSPDAGLVGCTQQ